MRIWLAYQFRGVDFLELKENLELIIGSLANCGHTSITMLKDIQHWNPNGMPKSEAVRMAYELMPQCNLALCVYPLESASEGRGFDAGYFAGMGKPIVMAIKDNISIPYTEALFSENPRGRVIRYSKLEDIAKQL